jgi:hypothetical protein
MARLAKRGRALPPRRKEGVEQQTPRRPLQIALERTRQGCYGICAGSFVAVPAAMLGDHVPSLQMVGAIGGIALFAGMTGLLIEVVETRVFPGGMNGS